MFLCFSTCSQTPALQLFFLCYERIFLRQMMFFIRVVRPPIVLQIPFKVLLLMLVPWICMGQVLLFLLRVALTVLGVVLWTFLRKRMIYIRVVRLLKVLQIQFMVGSLIFKVIFRIFLRQMMFFIRVVRLPIVFQILFKVLLHILIVISRDQRSMIASA